MDDLNRWDLYFKNNRFPCFVADSATDEILYVNEELLTTLQVDESILGQKFYHALKNESFQFQENRPDWSAQSSFQVEFFHKETNGRFTATASPTKDSKAIFFQMSPITHDESQHSFEDAMTRCVEIYQQPTHTILESFMELLCEFYHCDRAYVYRFNAEESIINCVSQWSQNTNVRAVHQVGDKINSTFLIQWLHQGSIAGIVTASTQSPDFDPNSDLAKALAHFQVENMTLCTVENADHQVIGLVGLSNREDWNGVFDHRLINTISRFVAQDVTKEVIDATLFQQHHIDSLTGLYNRTGYSRQLDKLLENPPKTMGVISANVNGLKSINQNLGNAQGDKHIKSSTKWLKDHFGYDFFRLSGDEFVGIAPDISKEDFEEKVVELYTQMRQEENYDFSLGHTWAQGNYDFSRLVHEADTVMYINKQEYYSATKRHFENVNDTTLADLLSFLKNEEFMVYLQPQVLLEDGSLHGAEALIRRFDKTNQKMVFPDQFIPLYEQKSVIRHVDIFVIHSVCAMLQQWTKEQKAIPISVNLSRVTLQEYGIVDTIVGICDRFSVPHHLLVIEVTERVGLIENEVASTLIQSFKENGFNISLDDFGCAYSNIVTLAQIEVDEVKIDKSLVDNLISSKKNRVLVKNVLSMCNELEGASTLAEGIEDEEQAQLLLSLGCRLGQGYFYSRPIPTQEFQEKYMFLPAECPV